MEAGRRQEASWGRGSATGGTLGGGGLAEALWEEGDRASGAQGGGGSERRRTGWRWDRDGALGEGGFGRRQEEEEVQIEIMGWKTMNNFLQEVEEGDLTIHFPTSTWEQID